MIGITWFFAWQGVGLLLARACFYEKRPAVRLWLGSVLGTAASMWMPVLFAFPLGFTVRAHIAALAAGAILTLAAVFSLRRRVPSRERAAEDKGRFLAFLPAFVLCAVLLLNHTLTPDDGLSTGQCTYGDMCMHLGFITSLAGQGTFPPFYNILPTARLCYPFLCDSVSASLYLLGTPLRWAYMLPSLFALGQVLWGFLMLAGEILRKKGAAVLAFALFFLNGGLGIIYFLSGKYTLHELFNGFYVTPTNLTEEGIRWVNVIADMLIPQRATLYGWAVLFAALYLLYRAAFAGDRGCALPAGILGGILPMIHTHSFFALGLTAACWLIYSLYRDGWCRAWLRLWLTFGLTAVALAVPQLLIWTFHSVGGNGQFLRLGADWVNGFQENWLWFWLKNVGPLFLLTPAAYFLSDGERKGVYAPIFLIFLLGELVLFQPNPYDNNKLFYVGYLFACLLCADFLLEKLDGRRIRPAVLALMLTVCCHGAVLTLAREVYSGTDQANYQLFSPCEVEAAEFIRENTAPDAVFLTSDNHDNAVAVLTGRNIVCGSSSYLYFHGLDYTDAQTDEKLMLRSGEDFEALKQKYHLSYVYIGSAERYDGADEDYFSAHYPRVFADGNVAVYKVD